MTEDTLNPSLINGAHLNIANIREEDLEKL